MPRTHLSCICAAVLLLATGCASSKSGSSSESPNGPAIQADRAEASEQADGEKPVKFHTLLEDRPAGSSLPGCNTQWGDVNQTPFGVPGKFCARFRAGKPYGTVPLSVAIKDKKVVGVHVQLLYDEVQQAKSRYDEMIGQFLGQCTRKTGGDQHEVVDCDDYAVQVGWQLRHDQPEVYLFYARKADRILAI